MSSAFFQTTRSRTLFYVDLPPHKHPHSGQLTAFLILPNAFYAAALGILHSSLSPSLSLSLSLSLDVASVSTKQSFLVGITEQTATPHYVEMTRVVCSYLLKVAQAYSTARVTVKHDGQALRAFVAHSLRRVTPLFPSSGTNLA